MDARIGSSPSWGWASLLHGRSVLEPGLCWKVGNGASIDVWKDKWIPSIPSMSLTNVRLGNVNTNVQNCKVSDLIDRVRMDWDLISIERTVNPQTLRAIQAIAFGGHDEKDSLIFDS